MAPVQAPNRLDNVGALANDGGDSVRARQRLGELELPGIDRARVLSAPVDVDDDRIRPALPRAPGVGEDPLRSRYCSARSTTRVFPWPEPEPAEQDQVRALIASLRELTEPIDWRKIEEKRWIGDKLVRELGKRGLCGLNVPVAYGGQASRRPGMPASLRPSPRSTGRSRS